MSVIMVSDTSYFLVMTAFSIMTFIVEMLSVVMLGMKGLQHSKGLFAMLSKGCYAECGLLFNWHNGIQHNDNHCYYAECCCAEHGGLIYDTKHK